MNTLMRRANVALLGALLLCFLLSISRFMLWGPEPERGPTWLFLWQFAFRGVQLLAFVIFPLLAGLLIYLKYRGRYAGWLVYANLALVLALAPSVWLIKVGERSGRNIAFGIADILSLGDPLPFWTDQFREDKGRLPKNYPELVAYVTRQNSAIHLKRYDHVDFALLPRGQRQIDSY